MWRGPAPGRPLLLLHGWPEFWLTWEPVMTRLADRLTLFAPDLRGFGDSDKPDGPFGPDQQAADMLALMDALDLQAGRHRRPRRRRRADAAAGASRAAALAGLFFFDFVYPGIGPRMAEPERLNNIWYQSFNQMEMAPALVGATRESCRHYYRALSEILGASQACLRRRARSLHRQFPQARQSRRRLCALPRIPCGADPDDEGRGADSSRRSSVPTCVRWAEHDPLFPYAWTDRLGETFSNLDLAMFPGVGHFPHREDPDRAAAEIARSLRRIGWG